MTLRDEIVKQIDFVNKQTASQFALLEHHAKMSQVPAPKIFSHSDSEIPYNLGYFSSMKSAFETIEHHTTWRDALEQVLYVIDVADGRCDK